MRKIVFSTLILAGFLFVQARCMPEFKPTQLKITPSTVPLSVPVAGSDSALQEPTALIIEQHMDATTASGGRPGVMNVTIVPVSAQTGSPIKGVEPIALGQGLNYSFSNDRSQMAVLSYSAKDCERYCLRIIDLDSWQEITGPIPLKKTLNDWFTLTEFDENSRYIPLLVSGNSSDTTEALLIDRTLQEVAVQVKLHSNVYAMTRTPDGSLAVYGTQTDPPNSEMLIYTALLDGTDLHTLWEQTLPEIKLSEGDLTDHSDPLAGVYYDPARIFSPDGSKLYIVAADEPTLYTVDFQTRTTQSFKIEPHLSWLEKLLAFDIRTAQAKMMNGIYKMGVASQDGRYLFVVGQQSVAIKKENDEFEVETIPLGLQVIDTTTGTLIQQMETKANRLSLSQDGKTLLLNSWELVGASDKIWTDVMDLATWKIIQRLNGTASASRLSDGSQAWLVTGANSGSSYTADIYRPGEATPRGHITRSSYVDWVIVP